MFFIPLSKKRQVGSWAERRAVHYLRSKGLDIVVQNQRFGHGEVDIIAREGKVLLFVEVKMRRNIQFGHPEVFVSETQQACYHEAATSYMAATGWQGMIRFDIIAIYQQGNKTILRHFKDAF